MTTYPRANNRSLPEAEIANAPAMRAGLAALPFGQAGYAAPTIRRGKAGHFSDAALAGSSGHAIIPNPRAIGRWPTASRSWMRTNGGSEMGLALDRIMLGAVQPRVVIDRILVRTERLIACMAGQAAGPLDV